MLAATLAANIGRGESVSNLQTRSTTSVFRENPVVAEVSNLYLRAAKFGKAQESIKLPLDRDELEGRLVDAFDRRNLDVVALVDGVPGLASARAEEKDTVLGAVIAPSPPGDYPGLMIYWAKFVRVSNEPGIRLGIVNSQPPARDYETGSWSPDGYRRDDRLSDWVGDNCGVRGFPVTTTGVGDAGMQISKWLGHLHSEIWLARQ